MPKRIEVPGHGIIEFPDDMSDDQISQAIQNNILKQTPSKEAAPATKEEPKSEGWQNFWRGIREGVQAGAQATGNPTAGFMAGLLGGTAKQIGAVGELMTPKASMISDVGRELVKVGDQQGKVGSTIGEVGSYVAPYGAALKVVQGAQTIPGAISAIRAGAPIVTKAQPAATSLGRAGQAAAAGALHGGLTTSGDLAERGTGAAIGGVAGAAGETILPFLYGVGKGAFNQFKGVEPGRIYNPNTGFPMSAGPGSRPMTAEEQMAFPRRKSLPLPGTAGEQTGSRLYDWVTSGRPILDLAGNAVLPGWGGVAGEVLKSRVGLGSYLGGESMFSIAAKAIRESIQSNKLQGMSALPGATYPGLGKIATETANAANAAVSDFINAASSRPASVATPIRPAAQATAPQAQPQAIPQLPPPVYSVNSAGKVVQPGPRNVVIEGERMTLPENLNMSAVQAARPMQAQTAGPVQPTTLPTPTRTPKVVEGGVTAEERAKFDAMIKQAGGQPTAVAAADPYVALEQQLTARGLAPDVMKNTAINTRAKQIMDEAKANKIVISKKDATTQATVEYEKRTANLKKEEAAKKQEERAAREQAAKQAEERRLAEEKAAREAYEASPEGQAARAKAEADALAEQEKKRKAEEMRAQIRARTATPNEPPVAGPVEPTVSQAAALKPIPETPRVGPSESFLKAMEQIKGKPGKSEEPAKGMAALEEKISAKAPQFEDETSLVDMSRRQAIKEKMAANPVEIPESKPKATPSAAKSFDVKSWVTSSQKDGKRALDSHVLDDIEAQTGVKIDKKDIGDISSMTSKELKSHMVKVYDRMRKRQGK